jgi:hypothetical protein
MLAKTLSDVGLASLMATNQSLFFEPNLSALDAPGPRQMASHSSPGPCAELEHMVFTVHRNGMTLPALSAHR